MTILVYASALLAGLFVSLSMFIPVLVAAALFVPLEPVSAIVMSLFMAARGKWIAYAAITAHLVSSVVVGATVSIVCVRILWLL